MIACLFIRVLQNMDHLTFDSIWWIFNSLFRYIEELESDKKELRGKLLHLEKNFWKRSVFEYACDVGIHSCLPWTIWFCYWILIVSIVIYSIHSCPVLSWSDFITDARDFIAGPRSRIFNSLVGLLTHCFICFFWALQGLIILFIKWMRA